MGNVARVTSKGQVTIPKGVRERAGIAPGTQLVFDDRGDEIIVRRLDRTDENGEAADAEFEAYLDRVTGTLQLGMSTDEFMELLRGE